MHSEDFNTLRKSLSKLCEDVEEHREKRDQAAQNRLAQSRTQVRSISAKVREIRRQVVAEIET